MSDEFDVAQVTPTWIRPTESDLIWMEDDATRGHQGHETARAAWERIFGDLEIMERFVVETFDGGDCFYHRYADGRIYVNACDGQEIRFLKEATNDPKLQGYECRGNEYRASCGWTGSVAGRNTLCPNCLCHAYPRLLLYGRAFPGIARLKPLASSLSVRPAYEPPDRKLTFAELAPSAAFIVWPTPGDNDGHGGYLRGSNLFTKVNDTTAINGRGTTSTFPGTMHVLLIHV